MLFNRVKNKYTDGARHFAGVIPKEDTRPGTGLKELDGRAKDIEADEMLGEGD
ncbi:hypothetical protein DCCM_3532 [Desulfocucumis palustris]|uniref:Uncharacterized protein n=1 Tax=Desulfocucumis palustris TaxID=1898651 RepID=A0A2L2XDV3_9FIRM|nr:hypothetical protein [Desulfocucumis palustris]GBF34418.1 hypothetical protein DCCM_3532 [Desulfocucumis palustris]